MSEQMSTPTPPALPPPSGIAEWFSVWREAITRPNEQTYASLAQSPNAKLTTALLWIFLSSLISSFFAALVQGRLLRQYMQNFNFDTSRFGGGGGILFRVICGAPIGAVIAVVFFLIGVGIVYLLARMFGGRGTFDQLAYVFAAISTPVALVNGILTLLAAIPFVGFCFGLVSLLLVLYVLVLHIIALKGVSQFGWGQAAASVLLPIVLLCCCLSAGFFALVMAVRRSLPPGTLPFPTFTP